MLKKRICLFAGYSNYGKIEDYVIYYLKKLSDISDVYYLADCNISENELSKIDDIVVKKYAYKHSKYDFGSWQELINKIGYDIISQYDELILCNDSCFGPLYSLPNIFEEMNKKDCDFWGISENIYEKVKHLQSYFLVFKNNVFTSNTFKTFFDNIKLEENKMDIIYNYELTLTNILEKANFKSQAYFNSQVINHYISPQTTLNNLDNCYYWRQSIAKGFPFIKKAIFTSLKDSYYIENLFGWEHFLHKYTTYDTTLIKKFLKDNQIKNYNSNFQYLIKKLVYDAKQNKKRKNKDLKNNIKYIALYLPQFHTFKENDGWWGKGFTEWTNTKAAIPLFEGHYQPHEPHNDIGYYDLSDVNVMIKQSQMAKEYGIYGFSYYYYWFNGKKLMEKPLENMLNEPNVNIPFCLFWANHNWTRSWDAGNKEILLEQTYDDVSYKRFIDDIIKYFNDRRYIRINNKPVLLIYEADKIPNPKLYIKNLRNYAKQQYSLELYLISVQQNNTTSPNLYGYDAALETTPNYCAGKSVIKSNKPITQKDVEITFYDYLTNIFTYLLRKEPNYKLYKCVYPMWDNTPRRKKKKGWLFLGATPELFKKFLIEMTKKTINTFEEEEQYLFINAWNEWAEGTHLEPDKKYGYTLLEICNQVSQMSLQQLNTQGFNKNDYKKYKNILYPIKLFAKHTYGDIRKFKVLNFTIYKYKKKKRYD